MKPRFSIRSKFQVVISALLITCLLTYLGIASHVFKTDKTELVFDLNRSTVANLASDIDTLFRGLRDKLEIYALMSDHKSSFRFIHDNLLERDPDLIFAAMVTSRKLNDQYFLSKNFSETYGLRGEYFTDLLKSNLDVLLDRVQQKGEFIWNATLKSGPPLIGYGRNFIREDENGVPVEQISVLSLIKTDRILQSLKLTQISEVFVVNAQGTTLVHTDAKKILSHQDFSKHPLIQSALTSPVKTSVFKYKVNNEELLGAFSKSYNNRIIVAAEAPGGKVFAAVTGLVRRSFIFGMILVTAAFIAAVLLSQSLTQPITKLLGGMEKVSEGDLSTQIEVHSRDEIALLADSFNSMIRDLKASRQQLEEINRDLEKKVHERTAQLEAQNQAVKEAQEALLRTTRLAAVGEIAARAAHEVLNPLTSLMTRIEYMQKKLKREITQETTVLKDIQKAWNEDFDAGGFETLVTNWKRDSIVVPGQTLWKEDMDNLHHVIGKWEKHVGQLVDDSNFLLNEGQRMGKIVSTMRGLSTVKSNKRSISGHQVIKECHKIMGDLFQKNRIKVVENFSASNDLINIDRDEFIQSLTNLMRNSQQAILAAAKGSAFSGQIEIATRTENGHLVIDLSDNGAGIPSENQVKLFETQFSTKAHDEGTGLGLSISRRFMRAMGGDVQFVESLPLVRTVFRITLPLANTKQEAAA